MRNRHWRDAWPTLLRQPTRVRCVNNAVVNIARETEVASREAEGVFTEEAADLGVVPAGVVIVQARVGVVFLAGVEIAADACQAAGDVAKAVVLEVVSWGRERARVVDKVSVCAQVIGQRPEDLPAAYLVDLCFLQNFEKMSLLV